MKSTFLNLSILMLTTAAQGVFGQAEGVITYEAKINMHRTLPPEREDMKAMIPEFRTHQDLLVFNATESLHKPIIEEEPEEEMEHGGTHIRRMQRPLNETYVNSASFRRVVLQEFMGKRFLIKDSLQLTPWKLTSDTKKVKGYLCKQASFYHEERKQSIVAWYTNALRPFLGPENYNTLPGAVLEVDINDGERIITAINIELRALKKNELKVPSGGTKITDTEFREMVRVHTERMRANGGNIMIRN